MNRQLASLAVGVAFAVEVVTASGCGGQYQEAPRDLAAMPQRPDLTPPAESGVGIIAGEVRVETLAASLAVAFETVSLSQDGKLLATSSTDGHGHFRFEKAGGGLYNDGLYDLALVSARYRGGSRIQYARLAGRSYVLRATPRANP